MIGSSALEPGKMSRRKVPRQVRDGASRGVIFAASRHRVCDRGEGSQWVDKPDAAGPGSRPRVCVCSAGLDAGDGMLLCFERNQHGGLCLLSGDVMASTKIVFHLLPVAADNGCDAYCWLFPSLKAMGGSAG